MISKNTMSYAIQLLTAIILVSLLAHTSVSAKDLNEKLGDLSVSAAENLIAIRKGVKKAEALSAKTKKGLAVLRNNKELINNISKKLGNKRYADSVNGAVRQLTKGITKLDGAYKKVSNSNIGKVSKQLTKGVGRTIDVAAKTKFWLETAVKVKDLAEKENISASDVADLGMDSFVNIADKILPFSGTLTKSTYDSIIGIGKQMDIMSDRSGDTIIEKYDRYDLLAAATNNPKRDSLFKYRISSVKDEISQANDVNDLQAIYEKLHKEEIREHEEFVRSIKQLIASAHDNKAYYGGKKTYIETLNTIKSQAEKRLERIKLVGGDLEKKLREHFYLQSALIIAKNTDQQIKQTRASIKNQAEQLTTNKERILNISNKVDNENFTSNLAKNNKTESAGPTTSEVQNDDALDSKKQAADNLLSENKARANEYKSLYTQLKNDPGNQELKQRVEEADKLLRESTTKYIASRAEIRERIPGYGQPAYSRDAIRSRIDDEYSEQAGYQYKDYTAANLLPIAARQEQNTNAETRRRQKHQRIKQEINEKYKNKRQSERDAKQQRIKQEINEKYENQLQAERNTKRRQERQRIKQMLINKYWNRSRPRAVINKRGVQTRSYEKLVKDGGGGVGGGNSRTREVGSKLASGSIRDTPANVIDQDGSTKPTGSGGAILPQGTVITDLDPLTYGFGNYAYGTIAYGKSSISIMPSYKGQISPYTLRVLRKNFITTRPRYLSLGQPLSFYGLKESIPNKDSARANSLKYSDHVRVRSRDYGDYSYVAWGSWSGGKNTRINFDSESRNFTGNVKGGHFVYGRRLGVDDIPKSGSARYAGQVMGGYSAFDMNGMPDGIQEINSITGNINMAATFRDGNNSLSGTMNLDRNGTAWVTARFNTQNARPNPNDSGFKASLDSEDGGRGGLRGSFFGFGANAAEVGGNFFFLKENKTGLGLASGVFRAKKQ